MTVDGTVSETKHFNIVEKGKVIDHINKMELEFVMDPSSQTKSWGGMVKSFFKKKESTNMPKDYMSLNIYMKSNNQSKEQVSISSGLASWLGFVKWTDNDGNDEMFWDFRKDKPEYWEKPTRGMLESDSTYRLDHIQLVAGNTDLASDEKHKMEDA